MDTEYSFEERIYGRSLPKKTDDTVNIPNAEQTDEAKVANGILIKEDQRIQTLYSDMILSIYQDFKLYTGPNAYASLAYEHSSIASALQNQNQRTTGYAHRGIKPIQRVSARPNNRYNPSDDDKNKQRTYTNVPFNQKENNAQKRNDQKTMKKTVTESVPLHEYVKGGNIPKMDDFRTVNHKKSNSRRKF